MEEVLEFMEPWKNFKLRCEPFLSFLSIFEVNSKN